MSKKSNISKEEIGYFFLGLIPVSSGIYVGFRLAAYKDGVLLEGKSHPKAWPVFVGAVVTMAIVTAIIIGICCVVQWLAEKLRGDQPVDFIEEELTETLRQLEATTVITNKRKYNLQGRLDEVKIPSDEAAEQLAEKSADPDLVVCSDCQHLIIDHKYGGGRSLCPHCGSILNFKEKPTISDGGKCPHGHGSLREWEGSMRCWTCGYVSTERQAIHLDVRRDIKILAILLCVSVAIPSAIAISGGMTWPEAVFCAILLFAINISAYYCIERGETFWS